MCMYVIYKKHSKSKIVVDMTDRNKPGRNIIFTDVASMAL